MSVELKEITAAVAEFDRVAAGLETLRELFGDVIYPVATTEGMEEAKAARLAIRAPRYEIERVRKDAKAPLLALGKKLDAEAKRITDELLKIENPIQEQIAAEEFRKEREREAKVAAELARVEALQERVAELRGNRTLSAMSGSALIAEHITDVASIVVDDSFQEFEQAATDAKAAGLSWLHQVYQAAADHEAEQARIAAEREELARLRAEQARRDAEDRARREAEEREAKKAREAEEARAAEQRRIQREQDEREATERRRILAEQEAVAKAAREAEAARLRLEREAHEAQMRREREEQEAVAKAERDRIAEEERRAAAIRAEEQAKIAAERAQLARDQEAARKAAEPPAPTRMRPKAAAIVEVVAKHFGVSNDTAQRWLQQTTFASVEAA